VSKDVEECEGNFLRPLLRKEFGVKNEGVVKEKRGF
jgi:hypothetical protein